MQTDGQRLAQRPAFAASPIVLFGQYTGIDRMIHRGEKPVRFPTTAKRSRNPETSLHIVEVTRRRDKILDKPLTGG